MTTSTFSAGGERERLTAASRNGESAPVEVEAPPAALPSQTAPVRKNVKSIRPRVEDRQAPTMRELEDAIRAARSRGDSRRALVYQAVRMRRLRRAQRAAGATL